MSVQATAGGALIEAAAAWGLDPRRCSRPWPARPAPRRRATRSSTASPPGSAAAGIDAPDRLDQVEAVGGDAAAALDELLMDFGWRSLGTDLTPTLAEQPDAIVAMINGAADAIGPRARPDRSRLDALRASVPDADRARFDDLASVARGRLRLQRRQHRRAVLHAARPRSPRRARGGTSPGDAWSPARRGRRVRGHGRRAQRAPRRRRAACRGAGGSRAERLEAARLAPPAMVGDDEPAAPPVDLPASDPPPRRHVRRVVGGGGAAPRRGPGGGDGRNRGRARPGPRRRRPRRCAQPTRTRRRPGHGHHHAA